MSTAAFGQGYAAAQMGYAALMDRLSLAELERDTARQQRDCWQRRAELQASEYARLEGMCRSRRFLRNLELALIAIGAGALVVWIGGCL